MDAEIEILLRGHGLLDSVDDEPSGEGQEQIEIRLHSDKALVPDFRNQPCGDVHETLYVEIGYGEMVVEVLGNWLDGHSEFQNVYSIHRYAFYPGDNVAREAEIRTWRGGTVVPLD